MTNFIGGMGATVVIPLMKGDYPTIPEAGTVTYTVLDHSGTAMTGYTDTPLVTDAVTHTLYIPIPASVNEIAAGKKFERRTVVVSFIHNGVPRLVVQSYRLVPFLNHAVTPEAVRQFLGVGQKELPDEDIDLTSAYFHVEEDFAPSELAVILSTGTITELAANEAIRMKAVIDVLPSLRQRVSQMESNGIHQFKRVEIKDFDKLERDAWDRYTNARTAATSPTLEDMSFVVTTTDTDAITGE